MGEALPELKGVIKESCVDVEAEEEFVAGSGKAPVAKAVVAAHQLRWLVTQVCWSVLDVWVGFVMDARERDLISATPPPPRS